MYVSKETIAQFKKMGIKDRDIATYGMKPSLPSRDKSTLRTLAQMQKPLDEPVPMSDAQTQISNPELEENTLSNEELLDGAAWEEHVEEFCARLFGRKYEKQQGPNIESQQSSNKTGNVRNRPQKTNASRSKQETTIEDPIQKRYNDNINKIMKENEIAAKIRDKIIKEQEKEKERENRKRLKANKLNEKQQLKQEKMNKKSGNNVYSPPKNKFAITDEDLARAARQSRKGGRK